MQIQLPSVDWQNLIPDLVNLALGALGGAVYGAARGMLLAIWSGLFFAIPHAFTDKFGTVQTMQAPLLAVAGSGLVVSLLLLGVRTHIRGITGNVHTMFDHVSSRIMVILPVITALPWITFNAIEIESKLAEAVAVRAAADVLPQESPPFTDPAQLVALLIAAILGIRLWFKLAANVVHVAVAVTWAPAALGTAFVAESSWIANVWVREFFGRLIGAVLATIAVGVGMAIALLNSGVVVISLVGGAFLAAYDLVDWLSRTSGQSMTGVLGRAASMAMLGSSVAQRLMEASAGAAVTPAGATTHMTDAQIAKFYGYSSD